MDGFGRQAGDGRVVDEALEVERAGAGDDVAACSRRRRRSDTCSRCTCSRVPAARAHACEQSDRRGDALPGEMTHRIASHLGFLLLFSIACAPAPGREAAPPASSASHEEAVPTSPEPSATPTSASTPATTERMARLHHPGEPRTRSTGAPTRLEATAAKSKPAAGGPASPCLGRAPGERWAQPGGGTCSCRGDGQVTCRRVEAPAKNSG